MFAGLPLAVPAELDTGAVDQQVQGLPGRAIRDLHRDPRLPAAQRRIVRNRPIKPRHLDQAFNQPDRLPERKPEEHFQGQAGLDGSVREGLGSPALAGLVGVPDRLGIEPDRQRAALAQRRIVV